MSTDLRCDQTLYSILSYGGGGGLPIISSDDDFMHFFDASHDSVYCLWTACLLYFLVSTTSRTSYSSRIVYSEDPIYGIISDCGSLDEA